MQQMSVERSWPLIRDIAAFVIGGLGVLSQMSFIKHGPIDPAAVALFGPLMGVPFFLGKKK
jgi:hypothetical protein